MKTNPKAVHNAFLDQIEKAFAAAGIVPVKPDKWSPPEYTVQTRAGDYVCHASLATGLGDKSKPFRPLAVMGRFRDPVRAAAVVDCNPHTGKWNFHPGDRKDEDGARRAASAIVRRILSLRES